LAEALSSVLERFPKTLIRLFKDAADMLAELSGAQRSYGRFSGIADERGNGRDREDD
jgi:hypothetical protein